MSPDLRDRIRASLNRQNSISSRRAADIIKASGSQNSPDHEIDAIWNSLDLEIKSKLGEKEYKIKRFKNSIKDLLNVYSAADILRMDESCIKSGGGISRVALERILFDE